MVKITSNVYLKYSFVREVKVKKYITNRSYVVGIKQEQLWIYKKKTISIMKYCFCSSFYHEMKMLQIKTLDPKLQSLFIVQPTDLTCNINVFTQANSHKYVRLSMHLTQELRFKKTCKTFFKPIWRIICITLQGYKGQYNNFNAILWNFSVALRAKDVFVKYGNCHEQSH